MIEHWAYLTMAVVALLAGDLWVCLTIRDLAGGV